MYKTILAKKIINILGIYPSYFLIDFKKKNYSISDCFFWRTDNNFTTIFNFTNLLKIFYQIHKSNVEIIFFDRKGEKIKTTNFQKLQTTERLEINKEFLNGIEDYGTFYIFHNTDENFNSILRNSCYTGYSFQGNLPSFVHGNLTSASKNLNNNKINFNITAKSFFKKKTYFVQNYFNVAKTEILIMNPTDTKLSICVNDDEYVLKSKSCRLIEINKKIIKIKSNCYLIRPIIFSYENSYLDVYHG